MQSCHNELLILGGGICGLWLLAAARASGRSAILVERDALGGAQTLASQGMIHGGIKYALGGFTTPASETIASMPARWKSCIAGDDPVDLSGVDLLSSDYYLFSDSSLSSKVTAFFGSRALRGRVEPLNRTAWPAFFANDQFKGSLYRLEDIVLNTESLVRRLTDDHRDSIIAGDPSIEWQADGNIARVMIGRSVLTADRYALAAGAGNEALLGGMPGHPVGMQRRPLKQVMLRHPELPSLFAHAVNVSAGAKPSVTITTHRMSDGTPVWYLGGNVAETGVARTDDAQIAFAGKALHRLFPWLDLAGAEWATLDVDRAEPVQPDRSRPDAPHVEMRGNVFVCWPTKLTLTPLLADDVLAALPEASGRATERPDLPRPPVARSPWEIAFG